MADYPPRSITDDLLANLRSQSVGTAQQTPGHRFAAGQANRYTAAILLVPLGRSAGANRDVRTLKAGTLENTVHIAPVYDAKEAAKALPEWLARINRADVPSRHRPSGVADAKPVEGVEGVRAELDADADFTRHQGAIPIGSRRFSS